MIISLNNILVSSAESTPITIDETGISEYRLEHNDNAASKERHNNNNNNNNINPAQNELISAKRKLDETASPRPVF